MKWYGFVLIFIVVSLFCDFVYMARINHVSQAFSKIEELDLPTEELALYGQEKSLALSAKSLPKEPSVLFFFASWCRPCLIESPVIAKLAERKDAPFIGIAVRDAPERLESFLQKYKNPYQLIALDPDMKWSKTMRADKIPTAFILNAKGKAVAKINGNITEEFYFKTILPFIQELKNEKPL